MGCGKTMALLQVAFNYEEQGQKVCVLKPAVDTKAGSRLQSRIGVERETDFTCPPEMDLFAVVTEKYRDVSCVLVDEAQFLRPEQVDQLAKVTIVHNIPVICYGLRLNFRQQDGGFEGATRLLQMADEITEIKTICPCGRKATRNVRFLDDKFILDGPDVLIDGASKVEYRALCAKCYFEHAEKLKK